MGRRQLADMKQDDIVAKPFQIPELMQKMELLMATQGIRQQVTVQDGII